MRRGEHFAAGFAADALGDGAAGEHAAHRADGGIGFTCDVEERRWQTISLTSAAAGILKRFGLGKKGVGRSTKTQGTKQQANSNKPQEPNVKLRRA
jgi:hypothetical protein